MASRAIRLFSGLRSAAAPQIRCVSSVNQANPPDVETHTGQKFDKEDFRNVRFVDKPKHVNTQHAIKLIAEVPAIGVEARSVFCNGGDGALGHPKVYINLDPPGEHSCLYCGLRYFQKHRH